MSQQISSLNKIYNNFKDTSYTDIINEEDNISDVKEKNISISDSSSCEEESYILEYEKKYKLKFQINKKSLSEEIRDINIDDFSELEKEVIKNNYDYISNNINKKRDKLLCNGRCINKHNFNNIIDNIKNNKSLKTKEKCYKNNLYNALKNNIRGIKTIYNLLIRLIVIFPKYRNKCKCCISETDKELLKNFEIEYKKNEKNTNNQNILYLNFLINKFLGIVSLLPCECKFEKLQCYYTLNYCNYNDYYEIYVKTIPKILELLKVNHNINIKNNKNEISLIKLEKCIHEDIRYYNNFIYCKYNKYEKELTDDFNIEYIIKNLEIINEWMKNNFRICNLLFNEQNLIFYKYFIKNYENKVDISNIISKLYKNTNIIDINYTSNEENFVQIILVNNNEQIGNNLIKFVIDKLKEINKINKNYDINNFLLIYINLCLKYKKYKYGLEFIQSIENLIDNKIYYNMIENIINNLIINKDIEIENKILYFRIIYKNKINITNIKILDKLIEVFDGDLIISKFEKSDNSFIYSFSLIEDIIYIIKKCIINRKSIILDYLLYNLDEIIKNINKKNDNIINPYQILFLNKENDKSEIIYLDFLEVINKYKYNINEDFIKNNKFSYLNLCIKKNYTEIGIRLIQYNIVINNIYENKTIIFHCIDNKNHILANYILQKNKELGNTLYNNKNIINYLFEKKEEDIDDNIKIKFLLLFLKNNFININYQDKINQNIGFLILKSNLKKYYKIILFKIISNNIDPLLKNEKLPLIIYSMLLDEFEITYMLMNKLIESKKILKTINDGIFSYYLNNSDNNEINYIPIILKFIRDYDRSKILDSNDELDFLIEQNRCENIFVMILKIICYFIKDLYNLEININSIDNQINDKIKNNYIKSNKNLVKVNYRNSKIFYEKQEEINKYIELSNDNNDDLLETDTINNSNIWKTTTLETDSESSEIEVSKICFN